MSDTPRGTAAAPRRLCTVVGTGTEVGKTWVSVRVLAALRAEGFRVAARKPAQSYAPGDPTTDAAELAAATGEPAGQVCPPHRWYEVPMAPPMAASALGRPRFGLGDLVDEIRWPPGVDLGLVETAGGVRSPLAEDGDALGLIAALQPDAVVLVADAGLGTVNAVRLTVDAIGAVDRPGLDLVVMLNRFDPDDDLHVRNRAWLADRDGLDVRSSPVALVDALRPR